jgi:Tfp pilus assembly protein PilF
MTVGRDAEAEQCFVKALELDPDFAMARQALEEVHSRKKTPRRR